MDWGLYIAFLVPPLVLGLAVQWPEALLCRAGGRAGHERHDRREVARAVLDANGLHDVPVNESPGGPLSDHYDPRKRAVFLSHPVYAERSVSASAVAAHEVGHAIQHQEAYSFFRFRSALFPAVAISSSLDVALAGVILQLTGLALVAVALYAVAVLSHFVTLPVEFDASKRAGIQLRTSALSRPGRPEGSKVLNAAAMTYVAGALAALTQLLRPDVPGRRLGG